MWKIGMSGDRLYTARTLIVCGLPVREWSSMDPVVRQARLADGKVMQVSFIRTHKSVPLPFGADRLMLFFLTDKAILQQSPLLAWEYVSEYMDTFGIASNSGKNHRDVQDRFTRLVYMDLMVEILDQEGKTVEHWKCPVIDHARIAANVKGDGSWEPSMSVAEMLSTKQEVEFGRRFFYDLQEHPVPIPLELVHAAGKRYRLLDYMVFLLWRAYAGGESSFIPWRYLQQQFDCSDSNPRRWASHFREAQKTMRALPDPINQVKFDVTTEGVRIHPLPLGTQVFKDRPKLGYRPENRKVISVRRRKAQS